MKKLFFFRSSASSNGSVDGVSPPSKEKRGYGENPLESGMSGKARDRGDHSFRSPRNLFSKSRKQVSDSQSSSSSSGLRRSRSLSSAALSERLEQTDLFCVNDQSRSPSSSASSGRHQQCDHSSR